MLRYNSDIFLLISQRRVQLCHFLDADADAHRWSTLLCAAITHRGSPPNLIGIRGWTAESYSAQPACLSSEMFFLSKRLRLRLRARDAVALLEAQHPEVVAAAVQAHPVVNAAHMPLADKLRELPVVAHEAAARRSMEFQVDQEDPACVIDLAAGPQVCARLAELLECMPDVHHVVLRTSLHKPQASVADASDPAGHIKSLAQLGKLPHVTRMTIAPPSSNAGGVSIVEESMCLLTQLTRVTALSMHSQKNSGGEHTCPSVAAKDVPRHADHMRALARHLPCMTQLRSLNLSRSSIGSAGVRAVASALPALTQLTSLSLNETELQDNDARVLSIELPRLVMLQELDLQVFFYPIFSAGGHGISSYVTDGDASHISCVYGTELYTHSTFAREVSNTSALSMFASHARTHCP